MNEFQIISKLGEGAYSVVYKVRRLVDGNIYALKKVKLLNLSDKEKQNALNEVRILASVKSSYVVSYKEAFFDENESCLGIVMEYADKGDLYQKITEFKKAGVFFEESDIWRIFIQMVRGLKALHDLKILHRDMKSANIFLFNDGCAKLGDLNVSKVARRGLGYTQTGTPYYASPEVWKDQPYDSKSDIWSLGCVLYEMITLKPPFRAENMEGLYKKVIGGQFAKIPERFSGDLWEILKSLLNVQPETRLNCDQILKHPAILKRLESVFKNQDEIEDSNLLQTIRIPKNLLYLTERLPKANYVKSNNKKNQSFTKKISELPEIIRVPKKKKKEPTPARDENKENEAPTEKPTVNPHTEVNEERIIVVDHHSLSPERKIKVEHLESNHNSPKRHEKLADNEDDNKQPYDEKKQRLKKKKITDQNSAIIEGSNLVTQARQNLDNSINDINEKEKKKNELPTIKNYSKNDYEYQIKIENVNSKKERKYNHSLEKDYKSKINEIGLSGSNSNGNIHGSNNKLIKILPYVYNEHISNVYKNQNLYQNPSLAQKYDKKNYIKNYQKKPNLDSSINNGKLPVIPNRKLSPIRKQIIKV